MISKDAMVSSKYRNLYDLVNWWRCVIDATMAGFCLPFVVAEIWQVDETDVFGSDAFQLWMASEIIRDERYLETITMLRDEIGASR